MDKRHIQSICIKYELGLILSSPQRVHGGLLHLMWRIDTDKGSYAIKQLSKNIDLTNDRIVKNYELSERIASRFIKQGISAVSAMEKNGQCLTVIDQTGYLVYPCIEAKALDQHAVSETHSLKIAVLLAKIHSINLDEPAISQPEFFTHTNEQIIALIDKAISFNCPFAADLKENQANILVANEAYQKAISILKTDTVVSHGDLDQKNVLWDISGKPFLIDWESACKINPTYDLINTAFYWSGITTHFNQALFLKMITTYQNAGGAINAKQIIPACYGAFSWIGWLVYNIERACVEGEFEHKNLRIEQVNQTLATILRLQSVIPDLIITLGAMANQHTKFSGAGTLSEIIEQLELSLLEPSVRQSASQLDKLIHNDFIEFGKSGKVYKKGDLIDSLPYEEIKKFTVSEFQVKALSQEVALAIYKTSEDGITALRSSVWKYENGQWCIVFHQGTKTEG